MKEYLCKCNMCDTVMIDENPQFGAKQYDVENIKNIERMEYIKDEDSDEDNPAFFWACPKCLTDVDLVDYENIVWSRPEGTSTL